MSKVLVAFGYVLLCALTAVTGCGGPGASPAAGDGGQGAAAWSTPAAPPLPDTRQSANLTETLLPGTYTLSRSGGARENGPALVLDALSGGMEWAIYGFAPQAGSLDSLAVQMDVAAGSEAWIGLADYHRGAWEWHGPYDGGKTLAIDNGQYLAEKGLLAVAVMLAAGNMATVNALSIRTVNPQNQPPEAALTAGVLSGVAPLAVSFDAGGSSDGDGTIIEYAWDWEGDGLYDAVSDQAACTRVFSAPGLYSVHLRVTDDQFARDTAVVLVSVTTAGNNPPVADLAPAEAAGVLPLAVEFDAALSHAGGDELDSIVKYEWDWDGDGSFDSYGQDRKVSYTYTTAGVFQARLRVTDEQGAQALDTSRITASVPGNTPPTAQLSPSGASGSIPFTVSFDASGSSDPDGTLVLYEWDWDGDGNYDSYGAEAAATHVYSSPGLFTAAVRVTDDGGSQALATCAVVVHTPGEWSMSGRDRMQTRRSPFSGPVSNTLKWQFTAWSFITAPVAGADGALYMGCYDRRLYAVNPDGSMRWAFTAGDRIYLSSPALGADGTVYIGCEDYKLYAVDSAGQLKWSYATLDCIRCSPAVGADGVVYVGSNDQKLYALNPDGSLKWSYTTGDDLLSSPAIGADGTIYVGCMNGQLYALNPDGSLEWTYTTGGGIGSSPAIGPNGMIYVGSHDKSLYAIRSIGGCVWSYATSSSIATSPAIGADGNVYTGSCDGKLYALTPDGSLDWAYDTGEQIDTSSPAIDAGGTVYIGSGNTLYAISSGGSLRWKYTALGDVSSPIIGTDGTVYVGGLNVSDYNLYAIGPGAS